MGLLKKYYTHSEGYRVTCDGELEHHHVLAAAGIEIPPGYEVDHIDGNKHNNELSNLRVCTSSQNQCNRPAHSDSTSPYKGVYWDKRRCTWKAKICTNYKQINLGHFKTPENAATAYNFAAKKYHGEFAYYNKP